MQQMSLPAPANASVSLAAEPALNALNSLALLNQVAQLPALPAWVTATAAALGPDERHTNRLVFETFGGALVRPGDWPDFPAYLAEFSQQPPELVRDRALRHLIGDAELPADQEAFAVAVTEHDTFDAHDGALLRVAYPLLAEPARLQDVVLAHLSSLWERFLAPEWERASRRRELELHSFIQYIGHHTEALSDNLRAFVAGELPHSIGGRYDAPEHITLVPSPHTGRYVTRLCHGRSLWLFFHAPRNFAVLGRQTPISRKELLLRLEALADETRLRIIELFAQRDELTAQDIQDVLGLTQSTASRQLRGLALYISKRRGGGALKQYHFSPAQLDMTFRALRDLSEGASAEDQDARREAGDLRRFMDRRGRLTMFPTRMRDQLLVLEYLAEHFELGRSYTEKEVSELLARYLAFDDYATVRRELYDRMFLGRERDGSRYWRIDPADRARHYGS